MIGGQELFDLAMAHVQGVLPGNIGVSSVDVRLGAHFEGLDRFEQTPVDLFEDPIRSRKRLIQPEADDTITLQPWQFVLAETIEYLQMPREYACMFSLRSRLARAGLQQAVSVWARPNWSGHLVLELTNNAPYPLRLKVGMEVGQLHFFRVGI